MKTLGLMCLLVKFPRFWPTQILKSMFKFRNAEMSPKSASVASTQFFLELFDFVCYVCCVFWWKLDLLKVKIDVCVVYDITEFLRTAYRPFAYCVPSKFPLNTAYQKGGVTLRYKDNVRPSRNNLINTTILRNTEKIRVTIVNKMYFNTISYS